MSTASRTAERAELIRGLGAFCEGPRLPTSQIAEALGLPTPSPAEHTDLFVQQLPPYASVYLDTDGKIGGRAGDRIAGFWRATRLAPPPEPDHLASLLALWASITERGATEAEPERQRLLEHAAVTLVWEHLASWLTPYLLRVVELSKPFKPWADLVAAAIDDTLDGVPTPDPPVHLAIEPEALRGPEELVSYLLTPIRSGLVLARADLVRAAAELGIGTRIGERAFVLQSMFEQAGGAVVEWMATEASRQADLYSSSAISPAIGALWWSRSNRTHAVIQDLAR